MIDRTAPPPRPQEQQAIAAALEQFQAALAVNPDYVPAIFHLGAEWGTRGRGRI